MTISPAAASLRQGRSSVSVGVRVVAILNSDRGVPTPRGASSGSACEQSKDDEAVRCFRREIEFLDRLDHALAQRILVELHTRLGSALQRRGASKEALTSSAYALKGRKDVAAFRQVIG